MHIKRLDNDRLMYLLDDECLLCLLDDESF